MEWQMLTLVGEDRPGIVAQVTDALYRGGFNLWLRRFDLFE